MLLTLPAGQNAFAPGQINVAVQGIEGDEVSLGSLAEFLVLLLGELNIPLYPALDANTESINRLNHVLSTFIAELLAKKSGNLPRRVVVSPANIEFTQASAMPVIACR